MKLSVITKHKKLLRFCAQAFVAVTVSPGVACAGVAASTLQGVGMPIVQLMILAAFGWICSYITSALGHGQVAGMIKVSTIFLCIGLVIGIVINAISKVASAFGLSL